jgi:hypothetical protein
MDDMIEMAVPHVARKTGNEETAREYMAKVVSGLSRWADGKKVYEFDCINSELLEECKISCPIF